MIGINICLFLLFTSILINLIMGFQVWSNRKQVLFAKKKPAPTLDARHLLSELLSGEAVVQIQVLDKESIFLRSPKGML